MIHIKLQHKHARKRNYPEEKDTEHELEVEGDSRSVSPPL